MDKTDQIIGILNKVTEEFTLDEAFEEMDAFVKRELIFDHETACYDEIWENPQITAHNDKYKGPLDGYFFTLYRVKPQYRKEDPSEYFPNFKLILGRIGNTTVYRID